MVVIVIKISEGQTLTLQSPDLINGMIETDGQKYLITYTADRASSGMKRLQTISLLED